MPDYLSEQMERLRRDGRICMQMTDCRVTALNGKTETYFEFNGTRPHVFRDRYLFIERPFRFIVTHGPWQLGSTIVRRHAATEAGAFNTSLRISEDTDFVARVALQGPCAIVNKVLVNVYRRNDTTRHLTEQVEKNPVQARESDEEMYKHLRTASGLTKQEVRALNHVLSGNRRAIGNLLLMNGETDAARDSYKQAFLICPSIASAGRYFFSYLPPEANRWINRKKLKHAAILGIATAVKDASHDPTG
jgi:hypothetical protein